MNILFVCTGNTCRSPMAMGYLKSLNLKNISVKSRGISANGDTVSKNAQEAMSDITVDISNHCSQPLKSWDIAWADKIICMSESHKTVLKLYANPEKLFVLGKGIPDPFGLDLKGYSICRDAITSEIDRLVKDGFFNEIHICSMEKKHIKKIAQLEKICFSIPWNEDMILESFENGTKFFVALENDTLLGYVGITCILDEGYITNIAVFPNARKRGVATALLNRVFGLASDLALDFISLEVRASNSIAVSLYEKMGFKTVGKRKNFYSLPAEDALIMTKRFDTV